MATSECIIIPLTHGYSTIISPEDIKFSLLKWHTFYSQNGRPYARSGDKAGTRLHRAILSSILGRDLLKSEQVDHANGDSLDNRRENLRLATNQENQRNKCIQKNSTTGYKGVSRNHKGFRAYIYINKKQIYLGTYRTPEEAYAAYCKAAKEYFGEFARFE